MGVFLSLLGARRNASDGSTDKRVPPSSSSSSSSGPRLAPRLSDKDAALLELKRTRDKLAKYRRKLDSENSSSDEEIRQLLRANKKHRALLVLRLRKYRESELERIDEEMLRVLQMIQDVEWAAINVRALSALDSGLTALNSIHAAYSPEDVRRLLEDSQDAIEMESEISDLLSRAGSQQQGDADLELEYAALFAPLVPPSPTPALAPTLDLDLPLPPSGPALPLAPTGDVKRTNPSAVAG